MELTSSQTDALTELINIGYARAAGALSDLTGHRISLEVPNVVIHPINQISPLLQKVIASEVASVNQLFAGSIAGNAILILDREAALLLNRVLTNRPEVQIFDGAAREVITEVGNIVLNACLGVFGNLLQVQVTFTVPRLQIASVSEVLKLIAIEGGELNYALMIHTRFHMRTNDVSGYLVIILGVKSLDRLLIELKKWEERQLA
jgi:chemotaxis protein CheC